MYIIAHESGDCVKCKAVTEQDMKASEDGYCTLLNITDPENPTVYMGNGEWELIDDSNPTNCVY